jgi:hypothetical protein
MSHYVNPAVPLPGLQFVANGQTMRVDPQSGNLQQWNLSDQVWEDVEITPGGGGALPDVILGMCITGGGEKTIFKNTGGYTISASQLNPSPGHHIFAVAGVHGTTRLELGKKRMAQNKTHAVSTAIWNRRLVQSSTLHRHS